MHTHPRRHTELLAHTGQAAVSLDGGEVYPWVIDNKYYTARIHFRVVQADAFRVDAASTETALFVFHKDEVRRDLQRR